MIVDITCLGDDVIKVLIQPWSAEYCQKTIKNNKINIWVSKIRTLFNLSLNKYFLYSLDIVINTFPDLVVIVHKFFTVTIGYRSFRICQVDVKCFFYGGGSVS